MRNIFIKFTISCETLVNCTICADLSINQLTEGQKVIGFDSQILVV